MLSITSVPIVTKNASKRVSTWRTNSCSPSATRAIAEHWVDGFPDYRFEPVHLVAEGDMIAALMPFATLAADPWNETHLEIDTIDGWTIRLDGRAAH